MRKHLLAVVVILTAGTGCDNVEFGGFDFALSAPEPSERPAAVEVEEGTASGPVNVDGPLLMAGVREGPQARFVVVGEVLPEALRPFPDPRFEEDGARLEELTAPGAEWTVYSEGVRVGRLVVEGASPAAGFCGTRTQVTGVVELVPDAAPAERLLAMPASEDDPGWSEYREIDHVYDQRVASLSIAGDVIRAAGATWPELGVLDARDHIQAFQLPNVPGQSIAATFVVNDELEVGPPRQGAYSIFLIGQEQGDAYAEAYTWHRDAGSEGKGIPRYFDHLDWDGDGVDEILLDVFGAQQRWFAALTLDGNGWARSFQDDCAAN